MHHAIMQHAHRVCAAGPATPCSGVNKTYRKLTLGKAEKQISDGRLAAAARRHGGGKTAGRPLLAGKTGRTALQYGPFCGLERHVSWLKNGRRGGLSGLFRRVFPPKREQNAPPSERNRLWVNHLRKVLRGWRIYGRRAPDGRRRRSRRGCCKHCSPFLTVRSRAGRSAASRERTTHKRAPGPRCRPGRHAVSAPG